MRYSNPLPLYKHLASAVQATLNCLAQEKNTGEKHDWTDKHEQTIKELVSNFMPSGSGIDNATKIDLDKSTGDKLVFYFGYHHMNENGFYDGWTEHTLTVTPSLQFGFDQKITGRDRNQIKEYLYDVYRTALSELIEWDDEKKCYYSPALREAQKQYKEQLKKEQH